MEEEEGTIYVERPKYFFAGDIVDEMFKSFVEDLILVAIYKNKACADASAQQVREWVMKLRKFKEHGNECVQSVTLEWTMMKAATELQKEIDQYFSKKTRKLMFK